MKKTRLWLLLIPAMLLAAGCHKKQVQKKPDNLIPRNTMVNLIAESYLIEGLVCFNPPDTLNRLESTWGLYNDLFHRYHVTREQFNTSMQYYMGDEDVINKIMAEADGLLAKKRAELPITDTLPPDALEVVAESF